MGFEPAAQALDANVRQAELNSINKPILLQPCGFGKDEMLTIDYQHQIDICRR